MTDGILSRLTVSINTKDDSKGPVGELITAILANCGVSIAQKSGDKGGVHLRMEMTAASLEKVCAITRVVGPQFFGGISEQGASSEVPVVSRSGRAKINSRILSAVDKLVKERNLAAQAAKDPGTCSQLVTAPTFVPGEALCQLVAKSAGVRIAEIDAELATLGLIWEVPL